MGVEIMERPPAVHFITGPSRTGDVEIQLTVGVHSSPEAYALMLPVRTLC
ncbi:MAG: LUD domain-containing protein [Acidimicrobiales bacterium]